MQIVCRYINTYIYTKFMDVVMCELFIVLCTSAYK